MTERIISEPNGGIDEFEPNNSVLFLGSGFSLGANNIAGGSPPNGRGLRRHFIQELKLPADTEYDLQILSEEFANNDSQKLRDELYRIFRITSLNDAQVAILDEPWRRIYTTNYDDAVEVHRQSKNIPRNEFDISEQVPNKLPPGAVIHLHGSIRLVTPDNVRTSLVLGEASYVNQYVVRSPWYDQFQRDIQFASALYIIGYSLADYHIAALLLENPELAKRTVFIQGPNHDDVFLRRTESYGRTLFIGADGFAEVLRKAPRPEVSTDLFRLKSFRSLDPVRDRKTIAQPTASEVYDLLVYGDFDPGRLAKSQPSETYAIARAEAIRSAVDAINRNRALIVDGRIGNGKTLFLHLLAFELAKHGWTCLLFRPGHPNITEELAALQRINRLVIFVEHYSAAQDALHGLRTALPEAKFVIEIRTGTFEVRYHELVKLLPQPFDRVSLNYLTKSEMEALCHLCRQAGLPSPEEAQSKDLRDILLDLFNNQSIRKRIEEFLKPLFDAPATQRILTMTMLITTHQASISAGFVRSVIGVDPFAALKPLEHLAKEIFELSADGFRARSTIFSSFVIETLIDAEIIAASVVELTLAAAERRSQRAYRVLMSNMMAFSSLRRILRHKEDATTLILDIYERLRHDARINGEPLFWLQYAIAMTELSIPKLDAAQAYIQTAYRTADVLPGFQTFQIDTQAFRISLLFATQEKPGSAISNIEEISTGLERINNMLSEDSHRVYAVRVLEYIPRFISTRCNDMSTSEKNLMYLWLSKIIKALSALPDEFKVTANSEHIRACLTESTAQILRV